MIEGIFRQYVTIADKGVDEGFGLPADPIVFPFPEQLITDGAGLAQANKVWRDKATIAAAGNLDLDLNGVLVNFQGAAVNFTRIIGVWIHVLTATIGTDVRVGNAPSNPWVGWTSVAGSTVKIGPGGLWVKYEPSVAGMVVVAGTGDILRINNNSVHSADVYVVILGS